MERYSPIDTSKLQLIQHIRSTMYGFSGMISTMTGDHIGFQNDAIRQKYILRLIHITHKMILPLLETAENQLKSEELWLLCAEFDSTLCRITPKWTMIAKRKIYLTSIFRQLPFHIYINENSVQRRRDFFETYLEPLLKEDADIDVNTFFSCLLAYDSQAISD